MSKVLGTRTVILVSTSVAPTGSADISQYVNTASPTHTGDVEDITTFGKSAHVFGGTLQNATFSMGGVYESGSVGTPRALFAQHHGHEFTVTYRPEGTGSGLPQEVYTAILTSFVPVSPVTGHIMWTAEFQISDDIDYTDQS